MSLPADAVLVLLDPLPSLKPAKDTSLGLIVEAQRRGLPCYAAQLSDLSVVDGDPRVAAQALRVDLDATPCYRVEPAQSWPLEGFRWILMRKDPPVDPRYIWATQILELAGRRGACVLNAPDALRDWNEKLAISLFADLCAPTITSSDGSALRAFVQQQGEAVLKPLDGMGGRSIFRLRADDPNLSVVLETLTDGGAQPAMAQRYLPQIADGDKRILMIHGEPWPRLLARIPAAGESRGNLAAGGRGVVRDLDEADRRIAARVGPWLRERGVVFAGLDVIGEHLTEINVTSPTCVREIEAADGSNVSGALWEAFIAAAQAGQPAADR